jgi:hypothetical protein
MLKRSWADYEDDEDLPILPWERPLVKPVVKNPTNKFYLLELEDQSDGEYCIGCETGCDCESSHTC